jgi:hypothetical protein
LEEGLRFSGLHKGTVPYIARAHGAVSNLEGQLLGTMALNKLAAVSV